eukprot:TRINITY_DN2211_c0_g2_i5.p2 TRINITY_DN2211_c0_g2~~TRINITY_DN2211_c0_g2_i5.p2  ORF type:complete len:238 (-),score=-11.85 TRINITY_DN2211_c0_g2_i5:2699-3412(-)
MCKYESLRIHHDHQKLSGEQRQQISLIFQQFCFIVYVTQLVRTRDNPKHHKHQKGIKQNIKQEANNWQFQKLYICKVKKHIGTAIPTPPTLFTPINQVYHTSTPTTRIHLKQPTHNIGEQITPLNKHITIKLQIYIGITLTKKIFAFLLILAHKELITSDKTSILHIYNASSYCDFEMRARKQVIVKSITRIFLAMSSSRVTKLAFCMFRMQARSELLKCELVNRLLLRVSLVFFSQ